MFRAYRIERVQGLSTPKPNIIWYFWRGVFEVFLLAWLWQGLERLGPMEGVAGRDD